MNTDEFNDAMAAARRGVDAHGAAFPPDLEPVRHLLIGANQVCLDDLAFIVGKATRSEDESPIIRATVAPKANGRRIC